MGIAKNRVGEDISVKWLFDPKTNIFTLLLNDDMNFGVLHAGIEKETNSIDAKIFMKSIEVAEKGKGNGTLLLNELFKVILILQLSDKIIKEKIQFVEIYGDLISVDKFNGHWNTSLPFYFKYGQKHSDQLEFSLSGEDGKLYKDIREFAEKESQGRVSHKIKSLPLRLV